MSEIEREREGEREGERERAGSDVRGPAIDDAAPPSLTVKGEMERALQTWRTKALRAVLTVSVVAGLLAVYGPISEAVRNPQNWPRALTFVAVYLFLVILLVGFRRFDVRWVGWSAILMGYAAAVIAFTRAGLAGSGRIYLTVMPVLAMILIGVRSGIVATVLSVSIMAVFAGLSHWGVLEGWLIYRDNPLNLSYWQEASIDLAMLLALAIVLLERFQRLQQDTFETAQQASADLARANAELERRVEQRTADLTQEIAERRRMEEALRRSQRRLEEAVRNEQSRRQLADTLRQVGATVAATLDQDEIIERILQAMERVVPHESASVQLLRDGYLEIVGGRGWADPEAVVNLHVPVPGDNPNTLVIETRQPHILADAPAEYPIFHEDPHDLIRSWLGVPLIVHDEVIGILTVDSVQPNYFTEDHARVAAAFADQVAIAMENARLFSETQRRVAELGTLTDVGQALSASLCIDEVLHLIYEQTRRVMYAENMIIMAYDQESREIECMFSNNPDDALPGRRFPADTGMTGHIIQHRQPILLRDNVAEGIRELGLELVGQPSASWLGVPMLVGERVLGVIIVQHYSRPNVYDESHQVLLETIASQAAIAIENARLFEEIQREKLYSESLVLNSPAAIIVGDREHRIVSWNPAAEELFGYTEAEVMGQWVDNLIAPENFQEEVSTYTQQATQGQVVRAITRRQHRDGTLVDVELLAVPLLVEGERIGTLAIYHDITELQRARQDAEAASLAKSVFLATMSHEIRTPMNGVIGMTSLLLDTDLTPEQHEFVETIRQSGDALLTIINDILDFSKIEAGRMELENQPFDVRECVGSALDLLAAKAADKGLELVYFVAEDVPAALVGDVTRVRQILINLLSNAVKFTEQGEVVVQVEDVTDVTSESLGADPAEHEIHVSVRDTGIGIPPDRMDRLFQSFSQVDSSMTRKYGGTGLGLVISQRLSELMGGQMWVESELGQGSTFHFIIRAKAASAPPPAYLRDIQADLGGKQVLIVDDNATNRRILSLQTEAWGMRPRVTERPTEALTWIQDGETFDVALLDVQMPEMDGLTLAGKIREIRAAHLLPVVLLSSVGKRETGMTEDKFFPYLTKPIRPSHLYDVLVKVLVVEEQDKVSDQTPKHQEGDKPPFDPEMGRRHPLRILLAEDNAVNQKLALRLLERLGYRADVAGNGLEVLEALRRQSYDVVLMDVQMPEMDGLETTRRIRGSIDLAEAQQPRIIAMTANAMKKDREECLAAGMNDYISKPVRVESLVEALRRCPVFDVN